MVDLYSLYRMMTLKIMSRPTKSNQLFPTFQQCIYASSTGSKYSAQNPFLERSKCQCDLENQAKVTKIYFNLHSACHNIANGIKPGSYSKTTDNHVVGCSNAVC